VYNLNRPKWTLTVFGCEFEILPRIKCCRRLVPRDQRFDPTMSILPQTTLSSALNELATARVRGTRDSNEIVRKGLFVLEQKNGLTELGDDRKLKHIV
jgi:hypothetical protein